MLWLHTETLELLRTAAFFFVLYMCSTLGCVVSCVQAVLGGTVDVLTLDGMVSMKVPGGTQPDEVLVLKNKGVRNVQNQTRR